MDEKYRSAEWWEQLSLVEKKKTLFYLLVAEELLEVDSEFVATYHEALIRAKDKEHIGYADQGLRTRVQELRRRRKLSSVEQVKKMVNIIAILNGDGIIAVLVRLLGKQPSF